MALFAELLADVGYTTYPTRVDLMAGLKALDAKLPPGQWLLAYNFDNLLQGGDLSMVELGTVSKIGRSLSGTSTCTTGQPIRLPSG